MKKRLFILGLLIVIPLTLLVLKYALDLSRQKPLLPKEFAALVPAAPLAYVECSHLQTRLEQLTNSPENHTFRQSEFVKQVQQTEWWPKFSSWFEQFWKSLIIDPRHIIGTDVAVAVYHAGEDEILPGVILVGKVDRLAKIAERIMYIFDRVTGQIGITFKQEYQSFPIYVIAQPNMICPLYYTIAGDLGLISTALPLLESTILSAIGTDKRPVKTSPFEKTIPALPETRVVTWYLDLTRCIAELRQNPWLQSVAGLQDRVWEPGGILPFVTIRLDTDADHVTLRTDFFSEADISENAGARKASPRFVQDAMPANFPVVAALYKKNLIPFLQNWQASFPQWEWSLPISISNPGGAFGEMLECRVSNTLVGTVYMLPDISCLLETQHPELAQTFLDTTVKDTLAQQLPSIVQQALVKLSTETYRNTTISKLQVMFQEMFSYVVQNGSTILATNGKMVKNQIDALQAHPDARPYVFQLREDGVAFECFLTNAQLSELLQKFSQTTTFALLYPRQTHEQFYQLFPFLIHFLKPLPPVLIEGGTHGTGLYLEVRSLPRRGGGK